ncbi:FUSC family protein [Lutibacter sp.]|uniref:FUSC family protein n=1 Tax=Lutibacter sp. TaxID=1925666 RepID=UPI0027328F2B|nr:FUSC family membrane protein [Lutibacter sp.]MDP3313147.1 FUSC family membrane protein [Lutibacter sp.]
MLESIKRFFKSLDFLKSIVITTAMLVPVFLSGYYLNDIHIGFSMALGVLFCSPTDVPGSNKHVFYGIFIAAILSFSLTYLFGAIAGILWILLPLLGIFVFFVSYISVFGFRASLISFVGLMAIVLSFVNDYTEVNLFKHSLLIGLGGFWYLALTYIKTILFPKIQTEQLFIKTIEKTASYLKIRAQLIVSSINRKELLKKLFDLQIEINEQHETIREIILTTRSKSGFSNKTRRQQLLFSQLVDILELAISNSVDYVKFDKVFINHKEKVFLFRDLIEAMANQLIHISKVIRKEEKLQENKLFTTLLLNIDNAIDSYKNSIGLPKARIGTIMLLNLKNYQEKQVQNIISMERILNNYTNNETILSEKEANRFITTQDYDFKKFIENLSFDSPIFKHSLRLAVIVVIGFVVGTLFSMQNPYWILITIVVIMRPSFGLTKERSIQRVIGTVIGALIASVVILSTQNTVIYGVIAVISLPLAFSFIQLNYRNAAIFITLNVVFIYAMVEPNILELIKFRVIDTLIGATLSFLAMYFLWPSWQVQSMQSYFLKAIKSNQKFLKEIATFYRNKGEITTSYKLSRKDAFLKVGDLNAAFQRLNQDPKSKQTELSTIYEITVFSNTFLSSLTSLGTYIRNNKTSNAPIEFDVFIENICSNLNVVISILEGNDQQHKSSMITVQEAENSYDNSFSKLSKKRDIELESGVELTASIGLKLKETVLVSEQLKWLYNLSEKLITSAKKYKSKS